MIPDPWLHLVLGLTFILVVILLTVAWRRRRHRQWMVKLSKKYQLGVVELGSVREASHLVAKQEGETSRIRLLDTLVGGDDRGKYFAAERRHGRRRDHVLFFKPDEVTHIHGFVFSPDVHPPRGWLQRLFHRRPKDSVAEGPGVALRWAAPKTQWGDEQGLALAARIIFHSAPILDASDSEVLHLEVDQRRVLVRSNGALTGPRLDRFLADAITLRQRVLKSLDQVQNGPKKAATKDASTSTSRPPIRSTKVTVLR